jgi:acyl-CoA thioesterase
MSPPSTNYTNDAAADLVGIALEEVQPGYARVRLEIAATHLNGLGSVHGGIVFLMADTAFAYACNSRGVQTVAAACHITYSSPAKAGDVLIATAEEKHLKGRNGIYDVTVTNQDAEIVAHFRGNSFALKSKN